MSTPDAPRTVRTLRTVCMTVNLYGYDGHVFGWTSATLVCEDCGGTETVHVYPTSETEAIVDALSRAHRAAHDD